MGRTGWKLKKSKDENKVIKLSVEWLKNAIASKIEIGSKVIIIAMSIPIITSLLELVIEILPWIKK